MADSRMNGSGYTDSVHLQLVDSGQQACVFFFQYGTILGRGKSLLQDSYINGENMPARARHIVIVDHPICALQPSKLF
jgi:hypothetical protein